MVATARKNDLSASETPTSSLDNSFGLVYLARTLLMLRREIWQLPRGLMTVKCLAGILHKSPIVKCVSQNASHLSRADRTSLPTV